MPSLLLDLRSILYPPLSKCQLGTLGIDVIEIIVIPGVRISQSLIIGFDGIRALRSVYVGSDERGDTGIDSLVDDI